MGWGIPGGGIVVYMTQRLRGDIQKHYSGFNLRHEIGVFFNSQI